jgi:hypothetical protein
MKMPHGDIRLVSFGEKSPTLCASQMDDSAALSDAPGFPPFEEAENWSTLDSNGSSTPPSLDFREEDAFADDNTNTEIFPSFGYDAYPEERNGTITAEATAFLKSPQKNAKALRAAAHRKATSVDWNDVKNKILKNAEDAQDEFSSRLTHFLDGYDAVAYLNKAQNIVPKMSMPTVATGKWVDNFTETLQDTFQIKKKEEDPMSNTPVQDRPWRFAEAMAKKARTALVKTEICHDWQIAPIRSNLDWQTGLNLALANTLNRYKEEYGYSMLFGMEPIWVSDSDREGFHLFLDTGCTDIEMDGEEAVANNVRLDSYFELSEHHTRTTAREYGIKYESITSKAVENGEWEEVEPTDEPQTHVDAPPSEEQQVWEGEGNKKESSPGLDKCVHVKLVAADHADWEEVESSDRCQICSNIVHGEGVEPNPWTTASA